MNNKTPSNRRVSLACVPCRSKHLRCDATSPICARCRDEGLQCTYMKSRRGGRRTRPLQGVSNTSHPEQIPLPSFPDSLRSSTSQSASDDDRSTSEPSSASVPLSDATESSLYEHFVAEYYTSFHAAHPCALPKWALKQRLMSDEKGLETLIAVIRYIGAIYARSDLSEALKSEAERAVSSIGGTTKTNGFDVQAVLLLSIATYWENEPDKALRFLDKAIALALELGMQKQEYAYATGSGDTLLEECWRRTWWQVYMTDAHIAGSTSTFPFKTSGLEMSADLPCDEAAYECGDIPRPRTLADYDMREFLDDEDRTFSSFAELVGLTRGLDIALMSRQEMTIANAPWISGNTDATVTAWRSLLHPSKKNLVREDGTVDELLFKANMLIQTYVVDLHRQQSSLSYSPIEAIAHCSPPPPPESLRGCNSPSCKTHTAKVLRAIDEFNELLTLPTNIKTHTPFIICMISNLVIAHLAACRFYYKGAELKMARERVRLSMGSLKVLGEVWSMGRRTYREVGVIARDILGLKGQANGMQKDGSASTPEVHLGRMEAAPGASTSTSTSIPHLPPPSQTMSDVQYPDIPDVSMFYDPPSLAEFQLLDTNFDFCGLWDMNVPSMAVV
ncbi:putative C6 transcription factor [Aspergillus stella-maris]|uniref:putative C6 transcription factor n=1 Tax=Aspergillus stella-maris TaxID=1810926 RepID=UPI003CCDDC8E